MATRVDDGEFIARVDLAERGESAPGSDLWETDNIPECTEGERCSQGANVASIRACAQRIQGGKRKKDNANLDESKRIVKQKEKIAHGGD